MKQAALSILVVCLAMLAWGAPAFMTPRDYVDQFGGDINAYIEILSLADCNILQEEFDQLMEESRRQERESPRIKSCVGYMLAIADRLEELECRDGL